MINEPEDIDVNEPEDIDVNESEDIDVDTKDYMGELFLWSLLAWDPSTDIGLSLRLWTRTKVKIS